MSKDTVADTRLEELSDEQLDDATGGLKDGTNNLKARLTESAASSLRDAGSKIRGPSSDPGSKIRGPSGDPN